MIRKKAFLVISIGVITVSVLAFSRQKDYAKRTSSPLQVNSAASNFTPYTIILRAVDKFDDGRINEVYTETRFVAGKDYWKSIKRFPNGKIVESFCDLRGIFVIDQENRKLFFQGSPVLKLLKTDKPTHQNPLRTDNLLSYNVVIDEFQQENIDVKLYRAPTLNHALIKEIVHRKGVTRVVEPLSIVVGKPDPQLLKHDDYPVRIDEKQAQVRKRLEEIAQGK